MCLIFIKNNSVDSNVTISTSPTVGLVLYEHLCNLVLTFSNKTFKVILLPVRSTLWSLDLF